MLLDYQSLNNGLETITNLKPIPHKSFLENYVKAFFFPHEELNLWLANHKVIL